MKKPTRGIYLLPNIFTTLSLFSAFYAIVAAMKHEFEVAVIAIFVGMVADGLDGRVARLTNTQSEFGAQYDSLSDMVTFGVAPSLLAYAWGLSGLGKFGWLVAFMYTASVALRLARFNSQHDDDKLSHFVGLPCPGGAAVISSFIWVFINMEFEVGRVVAIAMAALMVSVALLMVSPVRYPSFKKIDFKGHVPYRTILLVVFVFIAVALYPSIVLLTAFGAYALCGPLCWFRRKCRLKKKKR